MTPLTEAFLDAANEEEAEYIQDLLDGPLDLEELTEWSRGLTKLKEYALVNLVIVNYRLRHP